MCAFSGKTGNKTKKVLCPPAFPIITVELYCIIILKTKRIAAGKLVARYCRTPVFFNMLDYSGKSLKVFTGVTVIRISQITA